MGLDTVELVIAIEEHFSVSIPDDVASEMETPGEIFDYLVTSLGEKRKAIVPIPAQEVVWEQLVDIIVNQLGVERREVTKTVRIVKDLGAD